ncbi:MAG: acyl-CoA thioesterase [Planctomycetaceae bacterium]
MKSHVTQIRVRYAETDAMGYLHHSNYLTYFEIGRTELFRAGGGSYRAVEESGLYLVVVRVDVRYKRPARYDDLLDLTTTIARITPARIDHEYELRRDGELLTTATSTLACVDGDGVVRALPDELLESSG